MFDESGQIGVVECVLVGCVIAIALVLSLPFLAWDWLRGKQMDQL
jgi:hypothetical protein